MAKRDDKQGADLLRELDRNRRMVEMAIALVKANADHRTQHGAYGTVNLRMEWQGGRLKEFRLLEESIVRDPEELSAQQSAQQT